MFRSKFYKYEDVVYKNFGEQPSMFEIQIGYGLIPLVHETISKSPVRPLSFFEDLSRIRNKIDAEYGLPLPRVHIRDNMCLEPYEYSIFFNGVEAGKGLVYPEHYHCFIPDPGSEVSNSIDKRKYQKYKEPVFGLDGLIAATREQKELLEMAGYTCVLPGRIIATHLDEIIKKNRTRILNQCMVNQLIEKVRISNPDVVTDVLFTKQFTISDLKILLYSLLEEHVSIRDMNTIMETIADFYNCINGTEKKLWDLLIFVRERLAYGFIKKYEDNDCVLHAIKISDSLTVILHKNAVWPYPEGLELPNIALDSEIRKKVELKICERIKAVSDKGYQPVILCDSLLRHPLANFLHQSMPGVAVISDREVMTLKGDCVLNLEGEVTLE